MQVVSAPAGLGRKWDLMKRWMIVGGAVVALALAGCAKDEPTASTPTTSASASSNDSDSPTTKDGGTTSETLSLNDCLAVSMANLGVISGNAEDLDKLKSYDPPSEVVEAADLIVEKGGIQLDTSDQDDVLAASDTLTTWVDAVCPS